MKVLFNEEKVSLIIELEQEVIIPDYISIYANENGLKKKQEIHFTPITLAQGKEIIKQFENLNLSTEQQKAIKSHILETAQNTNWDIEMTDTFYHLGKQYTFPNKTVQKESIVQLIDSSGLNQFIEYINRLMSLNLKCFGHITLFVKSDDPNEKTPGIAVNSEEDLDTLIIKVL